MHNERPFKINKKNPEKYNYKNYVCLPYLKFSDLLPEAHLFFYLALAFSAEGHSLG